VKIEDLWHHMYSMDTELLPSFMFGKKWVHKIFLTGKSINFIRLCCDESDWLFSYDAIAETETETAGVGGIMGSTSNALALPQGRAAGSHQL